MKEKEKNYFFKDSAKILKKAGLSDKAKKAIDKLLVLLDERFMFWSK